MIRILKYLAIIFTVMFFVTFGCATAGSYQKLGGNPAVLQTGSTLGMSSEELQEVLGPPMQENTCRAPAMREGKRVLLAGKSMLWKHEVNNMKELSHSEYGIVTCLIKGIAVAEHREWVEIRGSKVHTGSSDRIDTALVQDIADGRFKPEEPKTKLDKLIEANPSPKFEI